MMLRTEAIAVRYADAAAPALSGLDLALSAGELLAVVGPNGGGKTSLIRAILGLVPLAAGRVILDGRDLREWRRDELARHAALLPQREETPFSWTVEEMITFGRYARLGALSPVTAEDRAAVSRAMERADVSGFGRRRIETLSGGEWQRVRIARALAQEPKLLLLDEPTASLDLGHEMELFELVRRLVGEGLAALVVTHHLNVAARFADRMILLDGGKSVASGRPAEVLRADVVSRVFRWPVSIVPLADGTPQLVPERDYS